MIFSDLTNPLYCCDDLKLFDKAGFKAQGILSLTDKISDAIKMSNRQGSICQYCELDFLLDDFFSVKKKTFHFFPFYKYKYNLLQHINDSPSKYLSKLCALKHTPFLGGKIYFPRALLFHFFLHHSHRPSMQAGDLRCW